MSAPIITWPGHKPDVNTFVAEIDRIQAEASRPRLAVVTDDMPVERDPYKWRKRQWEHSNDVRRSTCDYCKQTGEIAPIGMFGEYEGAEPCPLCQWSNPYTYEDTDAPAF